MVAAAERKERNTVGPIDGHDGVMLSPKGFERMHSPFDKKHPGELIRGLTQDERDLREQVMVAVNGEVPKGVDKTAMELYQSTPIGEALNGITKDEIIGKVENLTPDDGSKLLKGLVDIDERVTEKTQSVYNELSDAAKRAISQKGIQE